MTARRLFCFGLGFSAVTLARRLQAEGWQIAGTCRGGDKAAELTAAGFETVALDRAHPLSDPQAALGQATHLLISIPPDEAGDPVLDLHGGDLARLGGLEWIGYLSTTGVYGDRGGEWVDETSALKPTGARSVRRVEAERQWLALGREHGLPVHVFRLAGIYGPGRNQLETVRAGTARRIVKPGQMFSRIHVEDIASVLQASMARPRAGAVYNVCDDEAAPPQDVIAYAADLLGVPPPPEVPFEQAELSPMARSFYADNKRVRNDLIHRELGVELAYPSYREGLKALLSA